ncbi:MAG: aminoacyl-histidine dipeptidase [Planctomycetota bacterium]
MSTDTAPKTNPEVRALEPVALWNHFADLNAVPRPSKKEERVIEFMKNFGENLGLETIVDEVGNVIVKKPATDGMEDRQTIVIQSHLDMVHQQNAGTGFDFENEGIRMVVDGDWVRADGTTLGADNGLGVASIMTLLSSTDIPHPAIEALFTIDEETGMTGAQGLKGGMLTGAIMLNLDTEEDHVLTIGCAGGIDITAEATYSAEPVSGVEGRTINVRGLQGGHSGMEIHLGRGNSNKLMNRILWHGAKQFGLKVHSIDGGGLRNAIPRESVATVAIPSERTSEFDSWLKTEIESIVAEYKTTDPEIEIVSQAGNAPVDVLPAEFQKTVLGALYANPNGIHRMSPDIDDLVQTSNNLARVEVSGGKLEIQNLTRSSVNTERDDLASAIVAVLELTGAEVTTAGGYPGWQPVPGSPIVSLMADLYEQMFGEKAHVEACHAGLECGIVGTNYPEMQMISFGPNIKGAHSPDERCQISSLQKFWKFLLETLKNIPKK